MKLVRKQGVHGGRLVFENLDLEPRHIITAINEGLSFSEIQKKYSVTLDMIEDAVREFTERAEPKLRQHSWSASKAQKEEWYRFILRLNGKSRDDYEKSREVKSWCQENIRGYWMYHKTSFQKLVLLAAFTDEHDAMMFRLKFGAENYKKSTKKLLNDEYNEAFPSFGGNKIPKTKTIPAHKRWLPTTTKPAKKVSWKI